jgi:hypothetical protein
VHTFFLGFHLYFLRREERALLLPKKDLNVIIYTMRHLVEAFKHWFVPHPGNDHQPHFLRTASVGTLIIAILFLECAFLLRQPGAGHSSFLGDIVSSVLVEETNQNRAEASLGTLRTNPVLQAAAAAKAADMAAKGYFAHTSPEGLSPWHWFRLAGYKYVYAGENLAVDFTDSKDVTNAWMNSPGHRANIMNGEFTEIGIASASGILDGRPTTFVVELFGTPAAVAAAREPAPQPTVVATKPITAPTVLSASSTVPPPTIKEPEPELFVAADETAYSTTSMPTSTLVTNVGTSGTTIVTGSLASAVANPNRMMRAFALFLMLLVLIAMGIKIFHVGFAYPRLIMNGMVVLIILTGIIVLNQFHFADATQIL